MSFLGISPIDSAATKRLIAQAAEKLADADWRGAVASLESAAMVAAPDALDSILDTLASLYVSRNQHEKLAALVAECGHSTPSLALAGLAVERNRRLGVARVASGRSPIVSLLPSVREHIVAGAYSATELATVCALLVGVKAADMAVLALQALFELGVPVEEELVASVLAAALDKNMKRDAEAIIEILAGLGIVWGSRIDRYRILLGKADLATVAPGGDKVVDFLRRNAHHMGKIGRGYCR
jgi:hypothetical protein